MPLLLKKFEQPTNVFVIGQDFTDVCETFSITDDYSSIDLVINDKETTLETDGFVFIFTEEELRENYDKINSGSELCDIEVLLLEDFVGEISLKIINERTKQDVLVDNFENWFNIKEYLMYQDFPLTNHEDEADEDQETEFTPKLVVKTEKPKEFYQIFGLDVVYNKFNLPTNEEDNE